MTKPLTVEAAKEADLPWIKTLSMELMEAMTAREGFDIEQSIRNCHKLMKDPAYLLAYSALPTFAHLLFFIC